MTSKDCFERLEDAVAAVVKRRDSALMTIFIVTGACECCDFEKDIFCCE